MNTLILVTYFLAPTMTFQDARRIERVLCDDAEVSWIESTGNPADVSNGPYSVNCEYEETFSRK